MSEDQFCNKNQLIDINNGADTATASVNVRGTLNVNRKQGKFIGSFAAYGYRKGPTDHHRLVIDRETFAKAQSLFNQFTRTAPQKRDKDLFSTGHWISAPLIFCSGPGKLGESICQ